ncbi:MAG: hypothetical protein OEU32_19215 [Acidimicrobiia bacterium]|nr:hypothetical protein [Acidimicrobiia bacterium]
MSITLAAEQIRAAEAFANAVANLLEAPGVRVEYQGLEEGYQTNGWVEQDLSTGEYRAGEDEQYDTGQRIVSEYVLVGSDIHARLAHTGEQVEDLDWSVAPLSSELRTQFVDEALTMSGRAGASLVRIGDYLETLPAEVADLGGRSDSDRPQRGYQVAFQAADIARYLREQRLELVGPSDPDGRSFYEFWVDEGSGALVELVVAGVQFHDGEAIDGFGGEISYAVADVIVTTPTE